MIKSFRHKGLRKLFETGSASGVPASQANRLRKQLTDLESAQAVEIWTFPDSGYIRSKVQCAGVGP